MPGANDSFNGSISGFAVQAPGMEYYIVARDASADARTSRDPANGAHGFDVVEPDEEGPRVNVAPIAGPVDEGAAITVRATVTDASGVASVELRYFTEATGGWLSTAMQLDANDQYIGTIPGIVVAPDDVRYLVEAEDEVGNTTVAPAAAEAGP